MSSIKHTRAPEPANEYDSTLRKVGEKFLDTGGMFKTSRATPSTMNVLEKSKHCHDLQDSSLGYMVPTNVPRPLSRATKATKFNDGKKLSAYFVQADMGFYLLCHIFNTNVRDFRGGFVAGFRGGFATGVRGGFATRFAVHIHHCHGIFKLFT